MTEQEWLKATAQARDYFVKEMEGLITAWAENFNEKEFDREEARKIAVWYFSQKG